ncbi:hypothetical protein A1Q2_00991 [Trichosporon asahii var. asahii CBS 8904]|uniref:SCP2 domain-containing protein n=1 Tax=Trichosporon asahii var. asahii (strain CBS 8904) TaxID=1220162 RepID=K1VW13_TRIAC|nr:hypothetical protein A1Q2_00991 [Trichosporon asahii var. asahii CBS 8904]
MKEALKKMPDSEKQAQIKKVSSVDAPSPLGRSLAVTLGGMPANRQTNGIFQLNIKNAQGKEATWVIDLKKEGTVSKGAGKKPDVNISMTDDTFQGLADGKVNPQKAFMTGQLKVKGNIMLATKLSTVLNAAKPKL